MELWVNFKYDENYEVSSYGRVKRKKRTILDTLGRVRTIQEKIYEQHPANNGYTRLSVCMYRNYTHRIVAEHFIPNPGNLPEVNHIDGNKKNNHASNLEWCSHLNNCKHASLHNLINKTSELRKEQCRENQIKSVTLSQRPVGQYTTDGVFVKSYGSVQEAARNTGIKAQNISLVASNARYRKTAGGYVWKYKQYLQQLKK